MAISRLEVKAFAKINLFLNVLKKRSDGFHDIETLFARISLFDTLRFTKIKDARIELSVRSLSGELTPGPDNLVFKAAELLKKTYQVKKGIKIFLDKKIPIAGGLGGGSSDAAS